MGKSYFFVVTVFFALFGFTTAAVADDGDVKTTIDNGIEWTYKVLSEQQKTCALGNGIAGGKYAAAGHDGNLVTPESLDGYQVVAIGYGAFYNELDLKSIHISEGVSYIDMGAFYGCRNLEEVKLPATLDSIAGEAFRGCSDKLTELTFPDALRFIGNDAFVRCEKLEKVTFGTGLKQICMRAFRYCYKLGDVDFPEGLEQIGYNAFDGCNMTHVNIPASVHSIGGCAFQDNFGLESVKVEPANAFYDSRNNCNAIMVTVDNPMNTGQDKDALLQACNNTVIPENTKGICTAAFHGLTGITEVVLPSGVTHIYGDAFENCTALTNVTLPASLRIMQYGDVFKGCKSLTKITAYMRNPIALSESCFDSSTLNSATLYVRRGRKESYAAENVWKSFQRIEEIDAPERMDGDPLNFATVNGVDIEYIVISEADKTCAVGAEYGVAIPLFTQGALVIPEQLNGYTVKRINLNAFKSCVGLTSVTLPNTVEVIWPEAFRDCTGLTEVKLSESTDSIYGMAFENCSSLQSIEIPNSVRSLGWEAFKNCTALQSVRLPLSLETIEGSVFSGCSSLKQVIWPYDLKTIGYNAFMGCQSLESCDLPDGVTSIGWNAFDGCSALTSLALPSALTEMGYYAFARCSGLRSIELPSSLTTIPYEAFRECNSLQRVQIPAHVTTLERGCFSGCSALRTVVLPSSLTTIEDFVFGNCNALDSVVSSITLPFEISSSVFTGDYVEGNTTYQRFTSATLYVPEGTRSLYAETPAWNLFLKIEESDAVGVLAPSSKVSNPFAVYSLSGHRLLSPRKGLNIIGGKKKVVR